MSDSVSIVEYREIPGFPGYRVGDDGSVWSCKRKKSGKGSGRGTWILTDQWKKLASCTNRYGYLAFILCHRNKTRILTGHYIVLTSFRGHKKLGQVARHLDGDRSNNRIENLCWGTIKENSQDMLRHGTNRDNSGEKNGCAKLNWRKVNEIRKRSVAEALSTLASEYGVSMAQVCRIVKGTRWRVPFAKTQS